jgi:glycosyltransferase involved in cell wall biosynthesis
LNPENRPVAAIFGRLARWKGQDVLIRAAARLPELAVWIVGDALFTEDDRAYAGELRKLASSLGGRVKLLGFRDDIPSLMKAADIVVHCSTAPEPFGRVIVEAMFARRPVVAARAGGPIEILADSAAGKLVSPGDAGSLEDALRRLLGSPGERLRLGEAGRQRAEAEYALPVVLKKTDAVLARFA